jgi:transcriptional regulator with XRE-family HTH domain
VASDMNLSGENIKIIFGLKSKQKRVDLDLTLQQLSKKSGLSASYLNEIEKGKKYPKPEKISKLAQALETTYEELISSIKDKLLILPGDTAVWPGHGYGGSRSTLDEEARSNPYLS